MPNFCELNIILFLRLEKIVDSTLFMIGFSSRSLNYKVLHFKRQVFPFPSPIPNVTISILKQEFVQINKINGVYI